MKIRPHARRLPAFRLAAVAALLLTLAAAGPGTAAAAAAPPAAADSAATAAAPAGAAADTAAAAPAPADSAAATGAEPVLVDRVVAIVDEEPILQSDLDREVELYRLERQYAGQTVDEPEAEVRREVLERLVESKLIIAAAKQADITVDEDAVSQEVDSRISELEDHFGGPEALRRELVRSGMTLADYKARLTSQLRDQQYLRAVVGRFLRPKVEVMENEVADYYRDHLQEMPATGDSLTVADILVPLQPSPERRREVQRKVAEALADLEAGQDFADVARKLSEGPNAARGGQVGIVSRGDLFDAAMERTVFTMEVGEISQPLVTQRGIHIVRLDAVTDEGRAVSQIFFPLEVTEADVAAARARAEAALARLRQGEPFGRVAAEVSADPASARRGGDLGTFRLEDLSPQFQEALKDLGTGQLSEPVATPAGFYIFLVKDRKEGHRLPFDEVKADIRRQLESEKLEAELQRYVASLRDRFFIDLKI